MAKLVAKKYFEVFHVVGVTGLLVDFMGQKFWKLSFEFGCREAISYFAEIEKQADLNWFRSPQGPWDYFLCLWCRTVVTNEQSECNRRVSQKPCLETAGCSHKVKSLVL